MRNLDFVFKLGLIQKEGPFYRGVQRAVGEGRCRQHACEEQHEGSRAIETWR